MLFAVVYAWLRLLLDLVDVRLRVNDPEAELLLLRHQLRVVRRQVKRPQLNTADRVIMTALSRLVDRGAWLGCWFSRRRCWAGIGSWCVGNGPPSGIAEAQVDHVWIRSSRS